MEQFIVYPKDAFKGKRMMKVRYSLAETSTYSGVMDISIKKYNEMKDSDEESLGKLILDHVDRSNPSDISIDYIDEFDPIGDEE